jgi:phospholipid/cholesterol/gamma-HCH transport system substrate-binding protein
MDKSRLETKVGLFVLIGLVLLAVLMVQFSRGNSLFRSSYTVKLETRNVGGLKLKSGVLLAGVQVGSVKDIDLNPSGTNITVTLQLYKNRPVFHDARFVVQQSGFLGDQFIAIIPTTNTLPVLVNGDTVYCEEPFDLQEVARSAAGFIQRLDGTAKKLDAAMIDLRAQVLNAQTLANFGTSITNLKLFTEQALDTVKDINGIVKTNGAQFGLAVSNAAAFSSGLLQLENSAGDILATNSGNINQATIADASTTFKQIAADLQAGKGLAGTVLQNPELATNVQTIAANLAVTSSNLNRLGLWGILWSHKPPDTNTTTTLTPRRK